MWGYHILAAPQHSCGRDKLVASLFFQDLLCISKTFAFLPRLGKIPDLDELQNILASVGAKSWAYAFTSGPGMKEPTETEGPNFFIASVMSDGVHL